MEHFFSQLHVREAFNKYKGQGLIDDWCILISVLGKVVKKGRHEVHGEKAHHLGSVPGTFLQHAHYGVRCPTIVLLALDDFGLCSPKVDQERQCQLPLIVYLC